MPTNNQGQSTELHINPIRWTLALVDLALMGSLGALQFFNIVPEPSQAHWAVRTAALFKDKIKIIFCPVQPGQTPQEAMTGLMWRMIIRMTSQAEGPHIRICPALWGIIATMKGLCAPRPPTWSQTSAALLLPPPPISQPRMWQCHPLAASHTQSADFELLPTHILPFQWSHRGPNQRRNVYSSPTQP